MSVLRFSCFVDFQNRCFVIENVQGERLSSQPIPQPDAENIFSVQENVEVWEEIVDFVMSLNS